MKQEESVGFSSGANARGIKYGPTPKPTSLRNLENVLLGTKLWPPLSSHFPNFILLPQIVPKIKQKTQK